MIVNLAVKSHTHYWLMIWAITTYRIKTDEREKTFRLHVNEVKLELLFNTMHAVQDVLDLFSMEWMDESEVIEDE